MKSIICLYLMVSSGYLISAQEMKMDSSYSIKSLPAIPPLQRNILQVYPISSGFGNRYDPITGKLSFHSGLDLPAPFGTPVYATADGVITKIGFEKYGLGLYIVVDHQNGFETIYGHLSKFHYKEGDTLEQGELIARVGSIGKSTGNHLHYAIRKSGVLLDPLPYCFFLIHNDRPKLYKTLLNKN